MDDRPVTLITGSRKGIGRFLAERYAHAHHWVIGISRSAADWKVDGYEHHLADVTDEGAVKHALRSIVERHGRLDNLINNAGIAAMNHSLVTPVSTLRRALETNVVGTFLLCRESARVMARRKRGRIVNFSTVAVPLRLEGESAYVASKAAVEALTGVLARELGPMGVTVNAVGPTVVDTDLTRAVPREKLDALLARQALPRAAAFEDVGNVVDFFLSPESGLVTGQCIYLGGP